MVADGDRGPGRNPEKLQRQPARHQPLRL
jgi:hypothetical protein